jgi:aryl-alcohol dehydrogenase-like predicted oxidoreductase
MEQRNIGQSGLRASVVGLGCNNFGWTIDAEASRLVVDKAFDLGVNFFDTAHVYGSTFGKSEEVLGDLIKGRRNEIVLATKFSGSPQRPRDNSRRFVLNEIENALRRLKTDWVDIYMIHWPDFTTPMEEVLRTLDDIVRSGKTRYIGVCNLAPWRLVEAQWLAKELGTYKFIAGQYEYNLLSRDIEAEHIPAMQAYGLGLTPYFPLASGLLTGKYLKGDAAGRLTDNFLGLGNRMLTEANFEKVRKLDAFAKSRERSLLELAMSWLAAQPVVSSVIAGATKPHQLEQNVAAAKWALSADDLGEIDGLLA